MDSFTISRPFAFVLSPAVCLLLIASPARGQETASAVRVIDPTLAATLHDGAVASATLRGLLEELDRSDVIVHIVRMQPRLDQRVGSLAFVHAASGHRLLRI